MRVRIPSVALVRCVAQFGSARALGAWGRRFKSCHTDCEDNRHILVWCARLLIVLGRLSREGSIPLLSAVCLG